MARAALLPVLLIALAGCQRMPETYAPPVQRQPFEHFRPYRVTRIVDMADGDVDSHIVRDIPTGGDGLWRWTGQNPTVRVKPRSVENLVYLIDFAVAEATLKDTGPVTLTFAVNDHKLDTMRYAEPGKFHYEKPVPAEVVKAGEEAQLSVAIDKMWVSPQDGAKLGFILTRIGLRQEIPAK